MNGRRSSKIKMIWNIPRLLKTSWSLLKDTRVPAGRKYFVVLLGLSYFLFFVDLIPDFIPLLGQVDDLGVIFLLLNWFVNNSGGKSGDDIIEAEYYMEDEPDKNKQ